MKKFFKFLMATVAGVLIGLCVRMVLPSRSGTGGGPTEADKVKEAQHKAEKEAKAASPVMSAESPPYPVGYSVAKRRITITMSDGTLRTERDKELQNVERNSVTIDGEKLFLKPRPRVQSAPVPLPVPPVSPSTSTPSGGEVIGSWRQDPDGVYRLSNPSMSLGSTYSLNAR